MADLRLSQMGQVSSPINRTVQNMLLDNEADANSHRALLTQIFGSGSGAANRRAFRAEITEITEEMWDSIGDGSFDAVHVGMHTRHHPAENTSSLMPTISLAMVTQR